MTPDQDHAAALRRPLAIETFGRDPTVTITPALRAAIERAIEKLTELSQCSSCGSYERIVRQP